MKSLSSKEYDGDYYGCEIQKNVPEDFWNQNEKTELRYITNTKINESSNHL